MQFLENLWKKWKNIETLNLSQEKEGEYLASEQNYHATKFFTGNLSGIETRKAQILMNKPVHLVLSILDLS